MNPVHIDEKLSKDNRSYYKKETMYSYSVTHDSLSFYLKQGLIMPLSKTQAWTNKSTILTENDVKMINYECSLLKYIPVQYQNDSSIYDRSLINFFSILRVPKWTRNQLLKSNSFGIDI